MLLAVWGVCSSFHITRAINYWKKKNNDSLEKKKSARLDLAAKELPFSRLRFENG